MSPIHWLFFSLLARFFRYTLPEKKTCIDLSREFVSLLSENNKKTKGGKHLTDPSPCSLYIVTKGDDRDSSYASSIIYI